MQMKWIKTFSKFHESLNEGYGYEAELSQLNQNMGLGGSFTDDHSQKYQGYKTDPAVYWAVFDIDGKQFIAESGTASSSKSNSTSNNELSASSKDTALTNSMQKLADQIDSSVSGMGTDEELFTKLVTSIKTADELAELNRIMSSNPAKYTYKTVSDIVSGELGWFDQEWKNKIDTHLKTLTPSVKSAPATAPKPQAYSGAGGNSKKNVYAASVSKAVTAAAALSAHNGTLPTPEDFDKLKAFLVKSDNGVWNHFTELAGGYEKVNDWSNKMGWSMTPGRKSGGNFINAHDMCLFWSSVLNHNFPGAEIIEKVSNSCGTSSSRSRKYIPTNCRIGGKTGLYQKSMHDSAWIVSPAGRFSIVVLTELANAEIVAVMFGGLFREYCK